MCARLLTSGLGLLRSCRVFLLCAVSPVCTAGVKIEVQLAGRAHALARTHTRTVEFVAHTYTDSLWICLRAGHTLMHTSSVAVLAQLSHHQHCSTVAAGCFSRRYASCLGGALERTCPLTWTWTVTGRVRHLVMRFTYWSKLRRPRHLLLRLPSRSAFLRPRKDDDDGDHHLRGIGVAV